MTNPPFSLFREYVAQLMKYNKKFLIIGNQNAVTYKEIFPYIKNNEMWLGISMNGSNRWFEVPDGYEVNPNAAGYKEENGKRFFFVNGVTWFTNLTNPRRNEPMDFYKKYNEAEYPKYDNYDAIEVSKVSDIPMDYDGVMGVPITFLYKYCPEQFEIVELGNSRENFTPIKDYINPKKHLKDESVVSGGAINCVLAIAYNEKPQGVYYTSDNSKYLFAPYARILIRKK